MPPVFGSNELNYRWWDGKSPKEVAEDAWKVYSHLEEQDRGRQRMNLHHLRLYGNQDVLGVNPDDYYRTRSDDRITLNVVEAACDTAAARIAKNKPAPEIVTEGGNYSLARKSQLLERFLRAQFRLADVYETAQDAFLDAAVLGTGVLKIFERDKDAAVERVFPSEILVDPLEALYGKPRQIFQRKWIPRDVLKRLYADKKEKGQASLADIRMAIEEAGQEEEGTYYGVTSKMHRETVGDQVLVVEAWRLPSGPGAGDGKHAIFTSAGPLWCGEWEKDYLPFLFLRWKKRLRGFWGKGIAEQLCGLQIEINRLLIRLQEGHKRLGSALVFIDARSKVQKNAFTNEVGSFVYYMGNPPTVQTFQTAHPEIYQQLDRLWTRSFDLVGLSQDSAAPTQESISGISAQTQHDIGTERFSLQGQRYEEIYLKLSKQLIEVAKGIAARNNGNYALPAKDDRNTISTIQWSEVRMDKDEYIIAIKPMSALPQLASARLDKVILMLQAQMITQDEARELLDFPDLERFQSLMRAASDNIDRTIENILDEGVYEPPEPFIDIQLALKKAQASYNKAVNDGVEEDRLQLLRDYMTEAHRMMQAAQAEQQKLAMAAGTMNAPAPPSPGAPPAPGPNGQAPMAITPADGLV